MRRVLSMAFIAALAVSAPALAGQLDASSYFLVGGGVNAHVSYSGTPGVYNEYVGSGQIALTVHDLAAGPDRSLLAWCTDLFDHLYAPATYDIGLLITDHGKIGASLGAANLNEIDALIAHGDAMLAAGFSNQVSSAIQLAIWSVEYGSGFSFSSDDPTVAGLVATFVGNVTGSTPVWTPAPQTAVAQITSPNSPNLKPNQGLSYLTGIPEPATLATLSVGLVGLAWVLRKKLI